MNEIPAVWSKLRAFLLAILIFTANFSAVRADDTVPGGAPQAPLDLYYPVEFVGQDHVDLMWSYTEPGYDSFRIYRDNVLIQTLSYTTSFYRDSGVSFGYDYLYRVCAYNTSTEHETCGLSQTASVGQISGSLHQSVSWSGSSYYIAWPVHVYTGATLSIAGNAQLLSGSTKQPIDDEDGGAITLDGARVATHMVLSSSASSLTNSTVHDGADVTVKNDISITANTFTETASLTLNALTGNPPERTVANNWFNGETSLSVLNVEAMIANNEFKRASIFIADNAGAIIQDNKFLKRGSKANWSVSDYYEGVRVDSASSVVFLRNLFEYYSSPPDYVTTGGIRINAVDAAITIDSNTFHQAGVGTSSAPSNVLNNIMYESGLGFGGSASGEVKNNTISGVSYGIGVGQNATPVINANCIAGNLYGVYTELNRPTTLDLKGNWWGSPDGPNYQGNGALGDAIYGGPVDFSAWLTSDNCAIADIEVWDSETVQTVQSLNNFVPLVAGKPAALRAYLNSDIGQEEGVLGELTGYRGLLELGKWVSYNAAPAGRIFDFDLLRAERDKGLLFLLPEDWTAPGTLTVRVEANPSHSPEELDYANNAITETLVFSDSYPLRVAFVPISYQPDPGQPGIKPSTGGIKEMCRYMQAAFPTNSVACEILEPIKWDKNMRAVSKSIEWRYGHTLLSLLNGKLLTWNSTHPPAERFHQIVGLFPGGMGEHIRYCLAHPRTIYHGISTPGLGRASYCWVGEPAIHTLAHNFGLRHTNVEDKPCYAPDDWVSGYWGWTYIDNTIQDYGFDFRTGKVVPKDTPDLMSWCPKTWLSPLHYEMLLDTHWVPQPAFPGERPVTDPGYTPLAPIGGTYMQVEGYIILGPSGGGMIFDPLWTFTNPAPPEEPIDGTKYCFELQDSAGAPISSKCIDTWWANYEIYEGMGWAPFSLTLPLGGAYNPQSATRLVVTYEGAPYKELAASANPPQVTLTYPNGGETLGDSILASWQGQDLDGDTLSYRLFFSSDDGLNWTQLTSNLDRSTTTLDLSAFPGTAQGRLRVEVSDGFYSASDESDLPFTIPPRSPQVSILSPQSGERLEGSLTFLGSAYDPEDGQLSGSALSWASDIDGHLGTGDELILASLSQGEHLITLTATDADSHETSAQVSFTYTQPESIAGLSASNDGPAYMHEYVNFNADLTGGTNVDYAWAFGDGTYGNGAITGHVYSMYGAYTAVVTATNSLGSQTASTPVTINLQTGGDQNKIYLPSVTIGLTP